MIYWYIAVYTYLYQASSKLIKCIHTWCYTISITATIYNCCPSLLMDINSSSRNNCFPVKSLLNVIFLNKTFPGPWRFKGMVQLLAITRMTNQMKALQSIRKVFNWESRTTIYQNESYITHDSNIKIYFYTTLNSEFLKQRKWWLVKYWRRKGLPRKNM